MDAVLLIAFGGPTRPEEIRPFLANVLRGREHRIPAERIEEVVRHYETIGGRSPLNEITLRQAARLETALRADGPPLPVFVGMRNWAPYLADTFARMTEAGMRQVVGVILAPHEVEASRARYLETIDAARTALGARAPTIRYVAPWHAHPLFITAVADAVVAALVTIPAARRAAAPLVFTAHSVPVAMAARAPYVEQLTASARAVVERLGRARWQVAFQSRSGSPREPWLEPDVNDALRALAADGAEDVVVIPVGFVCDHVEVLYDLDVEARATAQQLGIGFVRASTVNDHPVFIRMLVDLVHTTAAAG